MGKGQRKDVAEGPTFGGVLSPGDKPLRFSGAPYLGWLGADRRSSHLGADPAIAVESASPHSSTSVTRFDGRLDPCANARIAAVELHGGGDVLAILGPDAARYVSGTNQVDYSASMTRHCCQVSGDTSRPAPLTAAPSGEMMRP